MTTDPFDALPYWLPEESDADGEGEIATLQSFGWEDEGRESRRSKVLRGIGTTLLASVVAVSVAAPVVAVAGGAVLEQSERFNNIDDTLPLDVPLGQHTALLDRNGREFARFVGENRVPVRLSQVSPLFVKGLVATEDQKFYTHDGIDFVGIARAGVVNATNSGKDASLQGGSTITQQLVENLRLAAARTPEEVEASKAGDIDGKLQEAKMALRLERELTKDQILERYVNTVYFGSQAYGVSAAARRYFGTSAARLTLTQAATLVGVINSPTAFDPLKNPEASRERRNLVLRRMASTGDITEAALARAVAAPLGTKPATVSSGCGKSTYPYYCAYVRSVLLSDPAFGATAEIREETLTRGGLTIRTALDPKAMKAAQDAADDALGRGNRVATGIAVVQPGTGEVRAVAQNRSWGSGEGRTEIVYATSPAQPGSSFKPITLAAAVEQGFSPRERLSSPQGLRVEGLDSPPDGFSNDDRVGHGSIDAYTATRDSVNTWYVNLVARVGVVRVADMAERLGVTSLPRTGPRAIEGREASITLGSYEVSPLDMASVYATFAARGVACDPTPILDVRVTLTGRSARKPDSNCRQEIAPEVADVVDDVIRGPLGPGGTASGKGIPGRVAGGKTGTTNDNAATWFVGITPQYSTAVWVGDPRGGQAHPLVGVRAYGRYNGRVFGATIAAPIWQDLMTAIHAGLPMRSFTPPVPVVGSTVVRTVPEVRGLLVGDATKLLQQLGYEVEVEARRAKRDPIVQPDRVVSQSPSGGSPSGRGTRVVLTLSPKEGSR